MTRARRALLVALALGGWAAAFAATQAIVALRYRFADPVAVAGSPGMWAFGDLVEGIVLFGALSVPGTWLLLRALRDADAFWGAVSWVGLAWAALAPLALALELLTALSAGRAIRSAPPALQVASALAVVRLLTTPAALPGLAVGWWACAHAGPRRRLRWATGLEAVGAVSCGLWLAWALLRART
jgi:hypothetical protein